MTQISPKGGYLGIFSLTKFVGIKCEYHLLRIRDFEPASHLESGAEEFCIFREVAVLHEALTLLVVTRDEEAR